MTYDENGRLRSEDELRRANNQRVQLKSNYSYIIAALIVLAIILGVLVMLPNRTDNQAVNERPATTTGAGTTSANPASQAPSTTGSPARPAPPATPGAPSTR